MAEDFTRSIYGAMFSPSFILFEAADGGIVCTERLTACKSELMLAMDLFGIFYLLTFHQNFADDGESSGFLNKVVTKDAMSSIR